MKSNRVLYIMHIGEVWLVRRGSRAEAFARLDDAVACAKRSAAQAGLEIRLIAQQSA